MSVRTIVVTTMTRVDSALRASALHCLKAIHSVRTIVLVTTMVGAIVLVRDKVVTSLVRVATSLVRVRKAAISPVRGDTSLARGAISLVRGATSLVRVRMVAISPVRADTSVRVATSVRDRVAISYQPRQGQGGYQQRPGGYQRPYGKPNPYKKGPRQHTADYDPNAKYSMKKRIEYKEVNIDPNEPLRLNKFLANAGICSRREADEFIQAGVVTVNGEVVTELGTKVLRTDNVMFHDQPVKIEKKVYVLLNKPKDYVTTSDDPQQRKTVMDLVKNACPERIYPVGRLDRNTTGVLLLTNDGDLASKLTHPKFLKKKIYHVFLDKNVTAHDLQQIAEGIQLEDGVIKADDIQYASPTDKKQVGIEIHSGKNRIVRRIFESLGYRVQKLDRVQFAGLTKKNLKRGDWRYLTEEEVDRLRMGAYE